MNGSNEAGWQHRCQDGNIISCDMPYNCSNALNHRQMRASHELNEHGHKFHKQSHMRFKCYINVSDLTFAHSEELVNIYTVDVSRTSNSFWVQGVALTTWELPNIPWRFDNSLVLYLVQSIYTSKLKCLYTGILYNHIYYIYIIIHIYIYISNATRT